MHRRRSFIENLHPIHADVARAGFGIARVHIRQGDEAAAVIWPAFQNRQVAQRKIIRRSGTGLDVVDDFLACGFTHILRSRVQQMNSLFEQTPAFAQIGRRFCFENQLNLLCDLCNAFAAERHRDPFMRAHRVDRHWKFRNFPINDRLLEEQGLSAAG